MWIFLCLSIFGLQQIAAAGWIGNRIYSIYYETHFLVKKSGIMKLIYFKPCHFGRYTLYEVFCFFYSYLQIAISSLFGTLSIFQVIGETTFIVFLVTQSLLCLFLEVFICIFNDIGSHRDEKFKLFPSGFEREVSNISDAVNNVDFSKNKRENKLLQRVMKGYNTLANNEYYTIYNLRQSFNIRIDKAKSDKDKIAKINADYLNYFKNLDKLEITKENKDGSLVINVKE